MQLKFGLIFFALGIVIAVIPHEVSHYIAARIFTDDVYFAVDGITPNVQIGAPSDIPDWGIQLMGLAPLLVGIPSLVAAIVVLPGTSPVDWTILGVSFGTGAASIGSGGDLLAVMSPQKFKKFAQTTDIEVPGFFEATRIIRAN